jgi:OFA family oxalate/formate antiporter-like MFS transporter
MKRWLVLIASIVMQSCLGAVYAWSTFVPALNQEYGIHSGRTGLIFGVCIASFTVSMVFGGALQRKYGPRRIGAAGGLLFLTGYLIGSFSAGNFLVLLAGFGVIAGAGIGFGYVCPLATSVRWFPRHKGLITGLTVAGFGLGSVFFSKAALIWLEKGIPVLDILRGLGLLVGTIVVLASCFLSRPATTHQVLPEKNTEFPLSKILKLNEFKSLFFMIFCGTFGGLLVIGNLKPIGLSLALSATQATFAVMLFAAGNAAGRIIWGVVYDRFGARIITWCMLLLAVGAGSLGLSEGLSGFYLSTLLVAFSFGGCFVLFAARVADAFGAHRFGEIYPFIFLGYGIAGLIGPAAGGMLLNYSGSPSLASAVVVAVALIGAITAKLYCVSKIN